MLTVLMVIDAIIAVVLIATIVLQSGKSAGMGGSIGGAADTVFGGKAGGMDALLSKLTMVFGAIFAILTVIIAKMSA